MTLSYLLIKLQYKKIIVKSNYMKQEKMHWFLVDKISEDSHFVLNHIPLLHQFNKVLKFHQGEKVVLFDGKGTLAKCEIEKLDKKQCEFHVYEKEVKQRKENKTINLYFGIPKKNKFETILEKGVEVGVSSFTPLITERTEKLNIKKERAEKILIEASEQSENPFLPSLCDSTDLKDVIQNLNSKNTFVFHTSGEQLETKKSKLFDEINILIGPEGGWSEEEIKIFKDKNFDLYKVGDSVLKTETACIVIPFLFNIN